jgi:plasmid stabilization system protein ParE
MPSGDKSSYSDKQKRQTDHIEESDEKRGVPEGDAERRAWTTVNKQSGGGKKSGSGRKRPPPRRAKMPDGTRACRQPVPSRLP